VATGKKKPSAAALDPGGRRFLAWNRRFPLRPIRTDEELARANALVAELIGRDDLDAAEDDYLDVLGDLIWKYEGEAHPLPSVSGEAMLRHLIEARDLTQAEVARGSKIAEPTISAILAGRRSLNRDHIAALSRYFQVSPALFIPVECAAGSKDRDREAAPQG
jgi:HTH-type transcriptional regulator/antitoxin HigA